MLARKPNSFVYRYYSDAKSGLDHHFLYISQLTNNEASLSSSEFHQLINNTPDKIACSGVLLSHERYSQILFERKNQVALLFQSKDIEDGTSLLQQALNVGFEVLILFHSKLTTDCLRKIRSIINQFPETPTIKMVYLENNLHDIESDVLSEISELVGQLSFCFIPKTTPLDCLLTPDEVLQRMDFRRDQFGDIQTVGLLPLSLNVSAREYFYSNPSFDTYLALAKQEKKWRYWFASFLQTMGLAGVFAFFAWVIKVLLNPSAYNIRSELNVWIQRLYHFFVKLFWGIYRIFDGKSGIRYQLNRIFWGTWSLRGSVKLILVKVYWKVRHLFAVIFQFWRLRVLALRLWGLSMRLWGLLRSAWPIVVFVFYPLFKIYWFTSYQLKKRVLAPLRGKRPDDI